MRRVAEYGLKEGKTLQRDSQYELKHVYQRSTSVSSERVLYGCRYLSEFRGYNQFMEVVTTSKETMLLYDSSFILL